jgi:hypothetical protein
MQPTSTKICSELTATKSRQAICNPYNDDAYLRTEWPLSVTPDRFLFSVVLTPLKPNLFDNTPSKDLPKGTIDKLHQFSPLESTCQKRLDYSAFSPGFLDQINSGKKKCQFSDNLPFKDLFLKSEETKLNVDIDPMANEQIEGTIIHLSAFNHGSTTQSLTNQHPPALNSPPSSKPPLFIANCSKVFPTSIKVSLPSKQEKPKAVTADSEEGCNCRYSGCLKFYCKCLREGKACNNCNCSGCGNHTDNHSRISKLARRANQLEPTGQGSEAQVQFPKPVGCNCRRSSCLKNYCDCRQFGNKCGESCHARTARIETKTRRFLTRSTKPKAS